MHLRNTSVPLISLGENVARFAVIMLRVLVIAIFFHATYQYSSPHLVSPRRAVRRATLRLCTDDSANAAQAFMQTPRATSGKEAFDGTTWSVLMSMNEGGSVIFTMQLFEDETCRFSDNEELGTWECEGDWVVVEKPKAFFQKTLFFTAKLASPNKEKPKWRLVEGIVQSTNASTAPAEPEAQTEVEVTQIGTFGANEFEEALLTTLGRFQTPSEDSRLPDLDEERGL